MADESDGLSTVAWLGIGAGVLGLTTAFALVVLPREATIERSIEIAAPPATVYDQVADLEAYQGWSPFAAADPTLEVTYGSSKIGVGASYSWSGDQSGSGTMTIRQATRPRKIVNDVDFGDQGGGTATWTFEPVDGGTRATWSMHLQTPGAFGGLFAALADSMVGPSFEDGLDRLKTQAEAK